MWLSNYYTFCFYLKNKLICIKIRLGIRYMIKIIFVATFHTLWRCWFLIFISLLKSSREFYCPEIVFVLLGESSSRWVFAENAFNGRRTEQLNQKLFSWKFSNQKFTSFMMNYYYIVKCLFFIHCPLVSHNSFVLVSLFYHFQFRFSVIFCIFLCHCKTLKWKEKKYYYYYHLGAFIVFFLFVRPACFFLLETARWNMRDVLAKFWL